MNKKEYQKTYIQFRTFIYQAKKVYGYLNITCEGIEGEYVRLSKRDLLDRLDMKYAENKETWEENIDTTAFKFYTKYKRLFYFGDEWLGKPEEVWID